MIVRIAGEAVDLRPDRTMQWRDSLYAADLHWGKAETFQRHGIPIPAQVLDADLARLSGALRQTRARRLVILGDLVHNARDVPVQRLAAWRAQHPLPIVLVRGNHDRGLRPPLDIEVVDSSLVEPPFEFSHARIRSRHYSWSGHVHPRYSSVFGGARLRSPCFVLDPRSALLPAFSEFTAGADIRPQAGRRVFVIADGELLEV